MIYGRHYIKQWWLFQSIYCINYNKQLDLFNNKIARVVKIALKLSFWRLSIYTKFIPFCYLNTSILLSLWRKSWLLYFIYILLSNKNGWPFSLFSFYSFNVLNITFLSLSIKRFNKHKNRKNRQELCSNLN